MEPHSYSQTTNLGKNRMEAMFSMTKDNQNDQK